MADQPDIVKPVAEKLVTPPPAQTSPAAEKPAAPTPPPVPKPPTPPVKEAEVKAPAPPPPEKPATPPPSQVEQKTPAPPPPPPPAKPAPAAVETPAAPPPAPVVVVPAPDAQEKAVVIELLATYKTYLTTRNANATAFQNAAKTLSNIVARILRTPTDNVLSVVWDFFVANKTGILQENCALQGAEVLDPQTRFRTEIVYTLFRMATNGIDIGNSKTVNLQTVQSRLRSQALVLFLQRKAVTVTKPA